MRTNNLRDLKVLTPVASAKPNHDYVKVYDKVYCHHVEADKPLSLQDVKTLIKYEYSMVTLNRMDALCEFLGYNCVFWKKNKMHKYVQIPDSTIREAYEAMRAGKNFLHIENILYF
jgi:hypothetical protein